MYTDKPTILLIDHDYESRRELKVRLEEKHLMVDTFAAFKEANLSIGKNNYDVIIANMHMSSGHTDLDLWDLSNRINPSTRVIVTSAYESYQDAFKVGEMGMFDYIPKCQNACTEAIMKSVEDALFFDAFVSYARDDENDVRYLCQILAKKRLRIWVDYERVGPGNDWMDAIQEAIRSSRSGIFVFGKGGIGKWQRTEINTYFDLAKKADKQIIPVLLPGVNELPADFPMLSSIHHSKLNPCLYSGCVCERLVSAILGQHRRNRRFSQKT